MYVHHTTSVVLLLATRVQGEAEHTSFVKQCVAVFTPIVHTYIITWNESLLYTRRLNGSDYDVVACHLQ